MKIFVKPCILLFSSWLGRIEKM